MKIFNNEDFSENKFLEYLNRVLEKKIGTNDLKTLLELINKTSRIQKIDLKELEYLGKGQSYVTIALGDFAFKIGPEMSILKNPYQMLPFRKDNLEESKQRIYTTQRCETFNINENEVQQMYNKIRDAGGLWLDPKEDNLGFFQKDVDVELLQNDVDFFNINKDLGKNDSNYYITDFEDLVFLTPELVQQYMDETSKTMTLPYGNLEGGTVHNRISLKGINSLDNIQEIYEKRFIIRSQTLLRYEKKYQLQKGNEELVQRYERILKGIDRAVKQQRYVDEQYYKFGRFPNRIKNKWNIKEIGIRLMQQTRVSKLKDIIPVIKQKLRKKRQVSRAPEENIERVEVNMERENNSNDPFRTEEAR